MIPVTDELLADMVISPLHAIRIATRRMFQWREAEQAGRLSYRRGGWYRLDGKTLRGRQAVYAVFDRA